MKRAIVLMGAGALVVTLGLGSGFAQQTSPSSTTPPSAVVQPKAPAADDMAKEKAPVSKPAATVGTEAAGKPAADKPADKATMTKPVENGKAEKATTAPKSMEKTVAAKPEDASKVEKNLTGTAPTGKPADKLATPEKALAPKSEQATAGDKSKTEQPSDKKEEAKPVVKQ